MIAEESSDLSSTLRVRCGRPFRPERKASHEPPSASLSRQWPLPAEDDWSTPFAEVLLTQLDLRPGLTILDIACGHGIPASTWLNRLARLAPVLGIDASRGQGGQCQEAATGALPWLRFECCDMRALPASVPTFQRITGNLSVMFLRPHRFEAMRGLIEHLAPGGQVVLTFPSLGTFDSIWQRIDQEMSRHGLTIERARLAAHVAERPSAAEARGWLERLNMERIDVIERPLQSRAGPAAISAASALTRRVSR